MILFAIAFLSAFSQDSHASATVQISRATKKMTISSHLIFYGPDATPTIASASTGEISRMWNEPQAIVQLQGVPYRVEFAITSEVVTIEQAAMRARFNGDVGNCFVMVEKNNDLNVSFWTSLGSNAGDFVLKDNLGVSTTTAHEYGHGLGLDHPTQTDIRGHGQPGIMFPRGTIVDSIYQWSPAVAAGQPGGTLNPSKRKVLQADVDHLNLASLNFVSDRALIGHLTNQILKPTTGEKSLIDENTCQAGEDVQLERVTGAIE